ncbi:MAG: hypothetical protein LUI85_02825 [Bacteroides sp.]|nr:hypothetical protein [Bacteroides sp.]
MNEKELAESSCPFFGHGDEMNDYGHCWNKNGEPCIQKCNGLLADGETPCAYRAGAEWQKQKAIEAFKFATNGYFIIGGTDYSANRLSEFIDKLNS